MLLSRQVVIATVFLLAGLTGGAAAQQPTRSSPSQGPTAAVGPCCPTLGSYEAAVYAFAHGERAEAIAAVAQASPDQVKRAIARFTALNQHDQSSLEMAAVLHLAIARQALTRHESDATLLQLHTSIEVFKHIELRDDALPFIGTWFLAATQISVGAADLAEARALVQGGLKANVLHGPMVLVQGLINEVGAEFDSRSVREGTPFTTEQWSKRASLQSTAHARLREAERAYRVALHDSSAYQREARLRLGRVLTLEGKNAEARTVLERALAGHDDPRRSYLAHLFLADLALRQKQAQGAEREYQAALAINPSSRVAYLGLSNVEQVDGDNDRARHAVRAWSTAKGSSAPDPFRLYQVGIDELDSTLETLVGLMAP